MSPVRSLSCAVILMALCGHGYALQPKSITEDMSPYAFESLNQTQETIEAEMASCESDNTGAVTIYTTAGSVQSGLDIRIDGDTVGSLSSHFPGAGPVCMTPGSAGVVTLVLPAGEHRLQADSPNLVWPSRVFRLQACECLLLPLSD